MRPRSVGRQASSHPVPRCTRCRCVIDLSGRDRHRRPGLLEDGQALCARCAYEALISRD